MTDNIPPEITDYVKCPEIGCDLMRRPAPAPVRISPEVRDTLMDCLNYCKSQRWAGSDHALRSAIAFVEALP